MTVTISVVIPFFRSHFIHETMASVLTQTCPPNEIIVVNDGAPEQDAKELHQYEGQARIIHQPNSGPAAARNAGVTLASGEWIAFLDDDDIWEPNRLALLSDYVTTHPDCSVVHNAVRIMGTESIQRKADLGLRDFLLTYPSPAKSSSVMLRKSTLLRSGMMNPALPLCEDYDCFLRVALTSRFHYIDLPLTNRRKHAGSLSQLHAEVSSSQSPPLSLSRSLSD